MGLFSSLRLCQQTSTSSLIPSIGLKDEKLCHDASSNTTASHLTVAMIALSLLCNHHYNIKSRANSALLGFPPIEHYKNTTEAEFKGEGEGWQHCEFSYLLSLKGFLLTQVSDISFRGCVQTTRPSIFRVGIGKASDSSRWTQVFTPPTQRRTHPQLIWYQELCSLSLIMLSTISSKKTMSVWLKLRSLYIVRKKVSIITMDFLYFYH